MLKRVVAGLVVSCGVGIAGCGGSDSVALNDLVPDLLDILCTNAVSCGEYPDQATCLASQRTSSTEAIAAVNAGRSKYDGVAAAQCLSALRAVFGGGCRLSSLLKGLANPTACDRVFKGTVADGAACLADEECVSASCNGSACTGVQACCAGTCDPTVASPVPAGGDCSSPAARCVDGTSCRVTVGSTTASATCAPFLAAGQPCDVTPGDRCADGLFCLEDATGLSTICQSLPGEGESCASVSACDDTRDYCNQTRTCVRKVAVGASCPLGAECMGLARCDDTTQTCVALGKAGETCDPNVFFTCLGSLDCVANTCTLPPAQPVCAL